MKLGKIVLLTTAHATEDVEKVEKALRLIAGEDAYCTQYKQEGHHGNPIILFKIELKKQKEIMQVVNRLLRALNNEERTRMCTEISKRLDETGTLHLRFDKQLAYAGELRICGGSDSVVIKLKIPTYPHSREEAIQLARELLCSNPSISH